MDVVGIGVQLGTLAAAVAGAAWMARRTNLREVEERVDRHSAAAITALESRVNLLTAELAEAREEIAHLRLELAAERNATHRLMVELRGDGR